MGFFSDIFHATKPPRQPLAPITMTKPDGMRYYLRARNIKSRFDDVLCFDDDTNRHQYMTYARQSVPTPSSWYFDTWEESAEERLQSALDAQRKTLLSQRQFSSEAKLESAADRKNLASARRFTKMALTALHTDNIEFVARQIESECPDFAKGHGLLQARCIEYYLTRALGEQYKPNGDTDNGI